METIKGTVSKIRVLKLSSSPLIRFNVNDINCLIAIRSLNFLAEVDENSEVVLCGVFNSRKQFVARKYCVLNKAVAV